MIGRESENKREIGQASQEMARDYAAVFSTPQGKRVLEDIILRLCRVSQRGLFAQNSPDGTAYNIGRHDVGVDIQREVVVGGTFTPKPAVRK